MDVLLTYREFFCTITQRNGAKPMFAKFTVTGRTIRTIATVAYM